ncbi:hypothetical protein SSIG_08001 [Streptomyces filamentosus NRRL 11379]|nr:hypothetical protein SSIG_08001 [Streptomyces filamentosus NRRL 11379]
MGPGPSWGRGPGRATSAPSDDGRRPFVSPHTRGRTAFPRPFMRTAEADPDQRSGGRRARSAGSRRIGFAGSPGRGGGKAHIASRR